MTLSEASAVRGAALFVSALQRSDHPTPAQVQAAVASSLCRHGPHGCTASLAQQYGDHPLEAAARMSWVLAELQSAYPQAAAPGPMNVSSPAAVAVAANNGLAG